MVLKRPASSSFRRLWLATFFSLALGPLSICGFGLNQAFAQRGKKMAEAAALGDQGMAAMQRQDYKAAAALFEAADRRMHSPMFVVFRSRALSKAGKLVESEALLVRVLQERPPSPSANATYRRAKKMARADRKQLLRDIPRLRLLNLTGEIQVDGRSIRLVRRDGRGRLMLNPGRHSLAVVDGEGRRTVPFRLRKGQRKRIDLAETRETEKAPAKIRASEGSSEPSSEPLSWGWPIASYVIGAGGLIAGSVLGVQYLKERDSFGCESTLAFGSDPCVAENDQERAAKQAELDELAAEIQTRGVIAGVALGIGGVGIVAGTVLTIIRVKSTRTDKKAGHDALQWRPWVAVDPRPGAPAFMGLQGRF